MAALVYVGGYFQKAVPVHNAPDFPGLTIVHGVSRAGPGVNKNLSLQQSPFCLSVILALHGRLLFLPENDYVSVKYANFLVPRRVV